ncbi:HNH endonuclease family protein [Nonomuraea ceibae]|uniref:HNH endonuclease family protein n=1 Tax=Nonomuraea ceibae TaxID=1935170 RepID=UPI001C5E6FC1|nr:HNH endonuclease family protein [Nonomuraea ceibae]
MPFPPPRTLAGVAAAAFTITLLPATATSASAAQARTVMLWDAVAALDTATESRDGYTRTAFRHWIDADRDSCSTRAEVLIEEAVDPPQIGERCAITGGAWHSYYDDVMVTDASALDIDHMVPLAEAWDSGASAWTAARRQAYANDLDEPRALVAVTARTNRSKADQDPATWLPPHEPGHCRYVADWLTVKLRWQLAADPAEKDTLDRLASSCPNEPLNVPDAP